MAFLSASCQKSGMHARGCWLFACSAYPARVAEPISGRLYERLKHGPGPPRCASPPIKRAAHKTLPLVANVAALFSDVTTSPGESTLIQEHA